MTPSTEPVALPDVSALVESKDYYRLSKSTFVKRPTLEAGQYLVKASRVADIEKGVASLVRRAKRLGLEAPRLLISPVFVLPVWQAFEDAAGRSASRKTDYAEAFHVVSASTHNIALNGYHFVATIEHFEDGNLLRAVPGEGPLPKAYRTDAATCDHCRTVRRRSETYVLRKGDKYTRVGSSCLADFLGDDNAAQVVISAAFEALLELAGNYDEFESEGGGGGGASLWLAEVYAATVAMVIDKLGWLSRSAAGDRAATADTAQAVLSSWKTQDKDVLELRRMRPTPEQQAEAVAALEWARNLPESDNDYLHNLRVIANQHYWTSRHLGIGASIIAAYRREQNRLKQLQFERKLPSVFLGAVGDKYGTPAKGKKAGTPWLPVSVLGVYKSEGQFGLTTIIRMQAVVSDAAVADLVWFASGAPTIVTPEAAELRTKIAAVEKEVAAMYEANNSADYDLRQHLDDMRNALQKVEREPTAGDVLLLAGTVKDHKASERTKRKETVMTRCVLRVPT